MFEKYICIDSIVIRSQIDAENETLIFNRNISPFLLSLPQQTAVLFLGSQTTKNFDSSPLKIGTGPQTESI